MLTIERKAGVKATYNILGLILPRVRAVIEEAGHSIGFHSFDHGTGQTAWLNGLLQRFFASTKNGDANQLLQCRDVDYRIKGYRPPQSKITAELTDENLCFHNFEWLASSTYSLGLKTPELRRRIVKIPILLDDFDLFRHQITYEQWERRALADIDSHHFFAISLHDCYGHFWLPYYEKFLEKMSRLGRFKTLDQVASEAIFASAQ
jgi:peptidoglycan/xylan/chitin deacetylase (PgdA/CDA1 family)